MKVYKILIITLFLFLAGCKSAKYSSTTKEVMNTLSSKQIIEQHTKQYAKFKTLQSRVKVEYVEGDKSQTHTINLRIEKDKTIWLSATLGVVRAKMTPQKVSFYNKLDHTYFEGDFSLISDLLGTELNFENVQNLLLGEALFDLNDKAYNSDIHEGSYVLSPKNQDALYEIFFLLNPTHFKMDSQQLTQPLKKRMLEIDYKSYQKVERQVFPRHIKIIALENNYEVIINMEFRSISLNNELRFPFRIPSGFEEIVIK